MPLLTLMILPVATVICAAIVFIGLARDDYELAGLAAGHMAVAALAQIACWVVL